MSSVAIPNFNWEKMKAVAEDELCPECDGQDHCAACLAIKGTRWALQMRATLEALAATPEQLLAALLCGHQRRNAAQLSRHPVQSDLAI
jgi:hypothetical protein